MLHNIFHFGSKLPFFICLDVKLLYFSTNMKENNKMNSHNETFHPSFIRRS